MTQHKENAPKKSMWTIRTIAYGGILTALVLLATLIKMPFPVPQGYVHLGDGVIFVAAMILGPFAAIPAALGSGLADMVAGYPTYIIATVLIKGGMGLFAGALLKRINLRRVLPQILIFFVAEVFMVGGYFAFEYLVFDLGVATANIVYNAFQGIAGVVIGTVCIPAILRFRNSTPSAGADA